MIMRRAVPSIGFTKKEVPVLRSAKQCRNLPITLMALTCKNFMFMPSICTAIVLHSAVYAVNMHRNITAAHAID
jgi:hypothetical protein